MSISKRAVLLLAAAAIIPACSEGSGGGPRPAVEGTLRLLARGGTGTAGNGGNGGSIRLDGDSIAGNVEAYTTGSVNAAVDIPNVVPYLGTNRRTVSLSDTWEVGDELTQDNDTVAGDGPGIATGLWVQAGVTLTIKPNHNTNLNPANNEWMSLDFADGVFIEGAVVIATRDKDAVGDGGLDNASEVDLRGDSIVIAAGGSITAAGRTSASGTTGGNGGVTVVYAYNTLINLGTVASTGADDDNGGDGGWVYLNSDFHSVFNGGTVDTSGGDGLAGNGGDAAFVQFEAEYGVYNNGNVIARGGSGTAAGGAGGDINMNQSVGALTTAGTLDTSGGSSTVNGAGGTSGSIDLYAYGGSARVAGIIRARGGNGGPFGGDGGDGGGLSVYSTSDAVNVNPMPEGMYVGADIDTSGGDGANGGDANSIYLRPSSAGVARPVGITAVGYAEFDCGGGDGSVNGGTNLATNAFFNDQCYEDYSNKYYGGRIYNEVPIFVRGGNGTAGAGGNGGSFRFEMQQGNVDTAPGTGITNAAPIDASGGDGGTTGGNGGQILAYYYTPWSEGAETGVGNSGVLTSRGGSGATTGGSGGSVRLYESTSVGGSADFPRGGVLNTGAISTIGGTGGSDGGAGGYIQFTGNFRIVNSGSLDSSGGNGTANNGGAGASCDFVVESHVSPIDVDRLEVVNSGSVTSSGGYGGSTGGAAGASYFGSAGRILNSGTLTAVGGTGGVNGGGSGGWSMWADLSITNTGAVNCNGGTGGTGLGGDAGLLELMSRRTTNRSVLTARGGDSTAGTGGDGDEIWIGSTEDPSSVGGSSMDVSGGAGAVSGAAGRIYIDGVPLSPTASF